MGEEGDKMVVLEERKRRRESKGRRVEMGVLKRRQERKRRRREGSSSECRSPLWLLSSDALISLESKRWRERETQEQLDGEGVERGLVCGLSL